MIGAGGMGEVYRARDTRLSRTVAIKVLPTRLADEPSFRQRLEREGRAAAALQHPHICALHDVGHQDGIDFLVMELLEGETLAARLRKGRLARAECLRYAREIAAALHEAHRHGVVHRDLKPGNVMLTRGGIKLVDFGLARLIPSHLVGNPVDGEQITRSGPLTNAGQILGTPAYLTPEQLKGGEADARSDIFAFGAVLYEMASGRRAFTGTTEDGLRTAILSSEPPPLEWPALERIVRACLAKDPDERWESAGDLARSLEWLEAGPPPSPDRGRGARLGWGLAVVMTLACVMVAVTVRRRPTTTVPTVRFSFPAPIGGGSFLTMMPAVSPDGSRVAFWSNDASGREMLWVRRLDASAATPLEGTEGAIGHFWSPDSESIGFVADQQLRKISVRGGPVMTIAEITTPLGATWSRQGQIVLATANRVGLSVVAATGGPTRPITTLDDGRGENSHRWPQFLPDGRRFLYLARSAQPENNAVYLCSLDGGQPRRVVVAQSNPAFIPGPSGPSGHLLFVRDGSLLAQRFDPDTAAVSGEPVVVAEGLHWIAPSSFSAFSVSGDGRVLAYRGATVARGQLAWYDRSGRRLRAMGPPGEYSDVSLSPDGRRVAVSQPDPRSGNRDVWVIDESGGATRLTSDPANDSYPVWSPDSERIVFSSDRRYRDYELYQRAASGVGAEEPVRGPEGVRGFVRSWSPDGQWIVVGRTGPKTDSDLWLVPADGNAKAVPLADSAFSETMARLSPSGRLAAYVSNETGRYEVYVRTLPSASKARKWRISTGGGLEPRWRGDGRELFYVTSQREVMAVEIKSAEPFEPGTPRRLFRSCGFSFAFGAGFLPFYDVSADGQKFLVNCLTEETASSPITVVVNGTAALKD